MRRARGFSRGWMVLVLALGFLPALHAGGEAEPAPPPAPASEADQPGVVSPGGNAPEAQRGYGTVRLVRPNGSILRVFSNGDIEAPDSLGISSLASPIQMYSHAMVFSHNIAAYRYLFESYEERGFDGEASYQSLGGLGLRVSIAGASGLIELAPFLAIGPPLVGAQLMTVGSRVVDPAVSEVYPTSYVGPIGVGKYDPTEMEEPNGEILLLSYFNRFDAAMPIHIGGIGGSHPATSWIKILPRVTFDFADPSIVSFQVGAELYLVLKKQPKGSLLGGDE